MIKIFDNVNRFFSAIGDKQKQDQITKTSVPEKERKDVNPPEGSSLNLTNQKVKYIYGFIKGSSLKEKEKEKEEIDILKNLLGDQEIDLVTYGGVTAIVCDSVKFNLIGLPREKLARYLLKHQQTIEKVMQYKSVIPMKLGTFVEDRQEVQRLIYSGHSLLKKIFYHIDQKQEIELVITWSELKDILREIGEEKEIKEFTRELLGSEEVSSFSDKVKIGEKVQQILDQKKSIILSEIKEHMSQHFSTFKENMVMDDQMIGNISFLIAQDKEDQFYDLVHQLNDRFKDRLNFKCVGPLPPYSFYTLEILEIKFQEVDWARKILLLNHKFTKNLIKDAYRQSASLLHPDNNPQEEGIEEKFEEIKRAYKILQQYCDAMEQKNQKEVEFFHFTKYEQPLKLMRVKE